MQSLRKETSIATNPPIRNDEAGSSSALADSSVALRSCIGCGEPIPAKRLAAMPNARMCVPCQESAGDIAPIRRFDEHGPDGEVAETYFNPKDSSSRKIRRAIRRSNQAVPQDIYFDYAVGDDSHLIREGNRVMDVARPLSEEFEDVAPSQDNDSFWKNRGAGLPIAIQESAVDSPGGKDRLLSAILNIAYGSFASKTDYALAAVHFGVTGGKLIEKLCRLAMEKDNFDPGYCINNVAA